MKKFKKYGEENKKIISKQLINDNLSWVLRGIPVSKNGKFKWLKNRTKKINKKLNICK